MLAVQMLLPGAAATRVVPAGVTAMHDQGLSPREATLVMSVQLFAVTNTDPDEPSAAVAAYWTVPSLLDATAVQEVSVECAAQVVPLSLLLSHLHLVATADTRLPSADSVTPVQYLQDGRKIRCGTSALMAKCG